MLNGAFGRGFRGVMPGRRDAASHQLMPGMRIEAERAPGRWFPGHLDALAQDRSATITYDDGCVQRGVALSKVRAPMSGIPRESPPSDCGAPWAVPPGMAAQVMVTACSSDSSSDSDDSTVQCRRVRVRGCQANASSEFPDFVVTDCPTGFSADLPDLSVTGCPTGFPEDLPQELVGMAVTGCSAAGLPEDFSDINDLSEISGLAVRGCPTNLATELRAASVFCGGDRSLARDSTQRPNNNPAELRCRLSDAAGCSSIDELRAALEEARRAGIHGPEVCLARDRLAALESGDMRKHASLVVEEAIKSDDFWKLQAAMATAAGAGLPPTEINRLKDAMRAHKRRKDAAQKLRKAVDGRSAADLRAAIEVALREHVCSKDVERARSALGELEAKDRSQQEAEQSRQKALQEAENNRIAIQRQLLEAAATKDTLTLRRAIMAVEINPRRQRVQSTDDALRVARAELRSLAIENMRSCAQAGDSKRLSNAMDDARDCGVEPAEIALFDKTLCTLREHDSHRQKLDMAVQGGVLGQLLEAVGLAKAAGIADAALRPAQEAVNVIEAREKHAAAKASTAQELRLAMCAEDADALAAAISEADRFGIDITPARERLRVLRAREAAGQELHKAETSGDVYRLRAAISTARSMGVSEADLERAGASLIALTGQVRARRALEHAVASEDANMLQRAIEEARSASIPRHEVTSAEEKLRSIAHTRVDDELRAAMAADDVRRLRAAVDAASHAGVADSEVSAAWERVRALEWRAWSQRELEAAVKSHDSARLQAAIDDARAAGVDEAAVHLAVTELSTWVKTRTLQQELRLAWASGSAHVLRAAIDAAAGIGLSGGLIQSAKGELEALERGAGRPPPPTAAPPPMPASPLQEPQLGPGALPEQQQRFEAPPTDPKWVSFDTPQTDPQLHAPSTHV